MKDAADMSNAELHDEVVSLDSGASWSEWAPGNGTAEQDGNGAYALMSKEGSTWECLASFDPGKAHAGDVRLCARYRTLAPELARRLRGRDEELRDVRQALDIGPGEPMDGEIVEAIEALQKQAARVAELERIVALLRCDAGRGASS